MYWVKWELVSASKDHGGLGLGSLDSLNRAMLLKWRWRYVCDPNALWVSVIKNIYNPKCFNDWNSLGFTKAGTWHNITKVASQLDATGIIPYSSFAIKVGDGSSTLFWHDVWLGAVPFKSRFPHLFSLEQNKGALVYDKWRMGRFWSSWRRNIRGGVEESEFKDMLNFLNTVDSGNGQDRWTFSTPLLKEFTVKRIRCLIDNKTLPNNSLTTRWNKLVPRKVNILAWRVIMDRLPIRCNLVNKGIDIPSSRCPLCNDALEDNHHVFGSCSVATRVWQSMSRWLQIDFLPTLQPLNLMGMVDNLQISLEKKCIIEAVVYCTWWSIWNYRNEKVFKSSNTRKEYLVDHIIAHSHLWFSNRSKKKSISWVDWLSNPLLFVRRFFLETHMRIHQKHHRVITGDAASVLFEFHEVSRSKSTVV